MSIDRKRVKVYVNNKEGQWVDHGTGYISTLFIDNDKQMNGIILQVRSETDGNSLLESKISTEIVYKKEQDTLIVWSENDNNLALSFQLKEGCSDIWQKICEIQGTSGTDGDLSYKDKSFDEPFQDLSYTVKLPPVELSKLDEIFEVLHEFLTTEESREKLATAIERESYIKDLIDVFHMCEDLENIEGLHTLYDIVKILFMLEKNSLFEIMFLPENIMDIVGMLEYNPSKKEPIPHREFLTKKINFKEVIPISNPELLSKIHQTYRLQYIKDILVPVPSLFDENMSTLSSFLFFCKIEIVTLIQDDPQFLSELFTRLTDDEISDEKRKDIILLLREICTFSQTLQEPNRNAFIKVLSDHEILPCMEQLLNIEDCDMKSAIVDIISCVVEFYPTLVREYLYKEASIQDEDTMLLNVLIDMLLTGSETGQDVILLQTIRNLLDSESMGLGTNKIEKSEFLTYFYRHCMHTLTAPIYAITGTGTLTGKDDFKRATILDHVIELVTFCVVNHGINMKNYVVSKNFLQRVLVLMQSKHKFLSLASLRLCRKIIGTKDAIYMRYIVKNKLLAPVVQALKENGSRYNLLNSAIVDLFEFIKNEDIEVLYTYICENHMADLKDIKYVKTFENLQLKYDQHIDRIETMKADKAELQATSTAGIIYSNAENARKRRDDRVLDEDEETWFDLDDEITSEITNANNTSADSNVVNSTTDNGIVNSTTTSDPSVKLNKDSSKLKDVDFIENLSASKTETEQSVTTTEKSKVKSPTDRFHSSDTPRVSPNLRTSPLSNDSPRPARPVSPKNNVRPLSPSNGNRSLSPQPFKPIGSNNTEISNSSPPQRPSSPLGNNFTASGLKNNTILGNRTSKTPTGVVKPMINIRIKTNTLNSSIPATSSDSENHLPINADSSTHNSDIPNHVTDNNGEVRVPKEVTISSSTKIQKIPPVKTLLTSLVDYPDDDDESGEEKEEEETIASSPAKKQRIESTT